MKQYYVYLGRDRDGDYRYLYVETDDLDAARQKTQHQVGSTRVFKKKLFKNGSIGAIFEVEVKDGTVSYNTKATPVSFWKNIEQQAQWQLHARAVELYLKNKRESAENKYEDILEPIRQAYRNADHGTKSLIVAEVIRIITK